jgi:23S rRNA (uracil1939-C5)-methyltransferase
MTMLLTIEKLIYGGEGLARTPADADGCSMVVLVPFVIPGERVEAEIGQAKPGFARGSLTRIVDPAAERIEAKCPYFRECGGCHYQHIPYARQLEFKETILRETLSRVGKIEIKSEIHRHASDPWNYRNRTRMQVLKQPEFALGYFRMRSHDVLPVRECPISSPLINRVIAQLTELKGRDCPAAVEEIEFFADAADEHILAWAFCGNEAQARDLEHWGEALRGEISEIAGIVFFPSRRRGTDEDGGIEARPLAHSGAQAIEYKVGETKYRVSAGAFFQVNRYLLTELVEAVTSGAGGETALDLYAGVGLFAAALAGKNSHIFAVEASQTSYADLRKNVPANVKAVGARAEDYLRNRPLRKRPKVVVVDPPRTGLGKAVVRSLVELGAEQVQYVSCDPATLARDLASLLAAGYKLEEAHLFDLFPQTYHIESVMLLGR